MINMVLAEFVGRLTEVEMAVGRRMLMLKEVFEGVSKK